MPSPLPAPAQVRKIPWRRKWQPTPVFFPGESHGQGSLEDYSPWGRKEWDMTERLSTHTLSNLINPSKNRTSFRVESYPFLVDGLSKRTPDPFI